METLLPDLLILLDLFGAGLSAWLGLHLVVHGWGWQKRRARSAGLALLAVTLTFALAAADGLAPLAGPSVRSSLLRLALLPLPLAWLLMARRLTPGVLAARARLSLYGALGLLLVALGAALYLGPVDPLLLPLSWLLLPAYGVVALWGLGAALLHTQRAQRLAIAPLERRALSLRSASTLLLLPGALLIATDLIFGLASAVVQAWLPVPAPQLRLAGSLLLLLGMVAGATAAIFQARADSARHLERLGHALAVTTLLLVVFLLVGGLTVWYWSLPRFLLGIFMLLALLTDALDNAGRAWLEGMLYRGETRKLRQVLRSTAEQLESLPEWPAELRPLLARLATQLNSPQMGLALRQEHSGDKKGGADYRIIAALRPAWEGQRVEVQYPNEWAERDGGGWIRPLQQQGQTVGVLVSERTGPLSPVQRQLLDEAAAEILQLLGQWPLLRQKREALVKTLDDYNQFATKLEERLRPLVAPASAPPELRRAVAQALDHYRESPAQLGAVALAKLALVERVLPPTQRDAEARGQALRVILHHLVEQLRPLEGQPPTYPDDQWLPYLVLTRVQLEGQPRAEFIEEYGLPGRRYNRARARGIATIARQLGELEATIRQRHATTPPVPPAGVPKLGSGTSRTAPPTLPASPARPMPQPQPSPQAQPQPQQGSRFGWPRSKGTAEGAAKAPAPDKAASARPSPLGKLGERFGNMPLPGRRTTDSEAPEPTAAAPTPPPGKGNLAGRFGLGKRGAESDAAAPTPPPPSKGNLAGRFGLGKRGAEPGKESTASKKGSPPPSQPAPSRSGYTRAVPKPGSLDPDEPPPPPPDEPTYYDPDEEWGHPS